MTNKAQQLTEQQLQEQLLSELDIIKKIGGAAKKTLDKVGGISGALATGIGKADAYAQKTLDKVGDVANYDWRQDNAIRDRSKQTYTGVGGAQIGKNPTSSNLAKKNQAATIVANDLKRVQELLKNANLKEQKSKMFNMRSLNEALSPEETKELAGLLSKHVAKSQDPKYAKLFSAGNAYLQKASGEAQRKARLEKKLGTTGAAATAANTAKTAVNKSIARNQKKNPNQKTGGIKQGINKATNQNLVPTGILGTDGKMTMRPAIDKNKDGKDDQSGKPMSKTVQDRQNSINNLHKFRDKNKIRIGNQLIDPNDPKNANIIKQVNQKSGT